MRSVIRRTQGMRSVIRRTQTHSRASRGHGERIDMFHRDGEGLELNGRQVRRAGNQVQSSAIKCNQVQSSAIKCHQVPSSAITEMARALSPTGGRCGHAETKVRNFALPASSILMSSDTSNAYLMRKESRGAMANQRPSAAIGGHQRPSVAIRGHQGPSEAIRGTRGKRARGRLSRVRSRRLERGTQLGLRPRGDRAGSTEHCLELGQCERREKNLG